MTKIKTARTPEGEKFYYLGHTQAVVDDNGNNIEDLLAEQEEKIELLNDNTGISDYPEFSTSKTYKTGTIVRHEGALFKFTSDHEPGIWDLGEVKSWSINAESQEKLTELGSKVGKHMIELHLTKNHSSDNDRILIDLKEGDEIVIKADFEESWSVAAYLYDKDGNSESKAVEVNKYTSIQVSKPYTELGFYININGISGTFNATCYSGVAKDAIYNRGVSFIGSQDKFPNINSETGIMTMIGGLIVDGVCFDELPEQSFSIKNNIPSTATMVVFNKLTKIYRAVRYTDTLSPEDVVIGGVRTNYDSSGAFKKLYKADFPFKFTIDGKFPWETDENLIKSNIVDLFVETKHSSDEDRKMISLKKDELMIVGINCPEGFGLSSYLFKKNGDEKTISAKKNRYTTFIADDDYQDIGFYINSNGNPGNFRAEIFVNDAIDRLVKGEVEFIFENSLPNIDTNTGVMTLEGVLTIGGVTFIVPNTSFSVKGGIGSGQAKIIYNIYSGEFYAIHYEQTLGKYEVCIGMVRTVYTSDGSYNGFTDANFPFRFTIDNKPLVDIEKNQVVEIADSNNAEKLILSARREVYLSKNHSSDNDRIIISAKKGDVIAYKAKGNADWISALYFYKGETSKSVACTMNKVGYFVCDADYDEAGIYVNIQSKPDNLILEVEKAEQPSSVFFEEVFLWNEDKNKLPNINATTGIMTMNCSIFVGGIVYEVGEVSFHIKNGIRSTLEKIVFNTETKEFYAKVYSELNDVKEKTIGVVKTNYTSDGSYNGFTDANFPFRFTIDNRYIQDSRILLKSDIWDSTTDFSDLFNNSVEMDSYIFFTDPHLGTMSNITNGTFFRYLNKIKEYQDYNSVSFVLCGGDWLTANDTQSEACKILSFINSQTRSTLKKYKPIVGNHDTNYQGKLDTDSPANTGVLTNETLRNLWYMDEGKAYYVFSTLFTKYIVLDSGLDNDKSKSEYRLEQLKWLADELKNSDKKHIVVCFHIFSNAEEESQWESYQQWFGLQIRNMCIAYNAKSTFKVDEISELFDFSDVLNKVEYLLVGHTHFDYVDTTQSIPIVCSANMQLGGSPTFDLVFADYENRKLHLHKVGNGVNRIVNLP